MWFKQARLFQLTHTLGYAPSTWAEKLMPLTFEECPPSFAYSIGWVSPIEMEGALLVAALNGYLMICLQIEEKILPALVIRQELLKKVKDIETTQSRKVGMKEKMALKDDITATLLPRAFSKLTRIYAYIDTKNNGLILGTCNPKKTEQFLSLFKKSMGDIAESSSIKKISHNMTSWLARDNGLAHFSIEKSCVLQDANQQRRIIRCQEQDLFANSIQTILKEGCEVTQLALNWQDRINFMLLQDFSLQSIRFKDQLLTQVSEMEAETEQQRFNTDFFIMTESLTALLNDLMSLLEKNKSSSVTHQAPAESVA